jgi:hypothetical protein
MTALRTRLQQPDVIGEADWRAAEILHIPDPTLPKKRIRLDTGIGRGILLKHGFWPKIYRGKESATPLGDLMLTVYETMTLTSEIYTDQPAVFTMIQEMMLLLVSAGMPQACYDEIMGHIEVPQSWVEANNTEVNPTTVGEERLSNG